MVELVKEDGITPIRIATWSNLRSKIEAPCPNGGMADTVDSKSIAEKHAGSSPASGTNTCNDSSVGRAPV